MKRFVIWSAVILVIVGTAAAGYFVYSNNTVQAAAEEPPVQTATVRQGNITISATGAGTVIPANEIELSFATAGVLLDLAAGVGDDVQAGDVLARLDDSEAQEVLVDAELQLAKALMQSDATSTEVGLSFDDISVAQVQIDLDDRMAELNDLLSWEPDDDEIAQAESALQAAQASLNAAFGSEAANGSNITVNNINLEQSQRDLVNAQAAWDTAFDPGREWEFGVQRLSDALEAEREAADAGLIRAQDNLSIAEANYNAAVSSSNRSSSASAQNSVLSAEIALQAAQTGPTDDEIEAAESAVRLAELALQHALLNRESNMLSLSEAQLNLDAAQHSLDNTMLIAPESGTIMAVEASVGENVGSSTPLIYLADLKQPLLEIYLDETDLDKVGFDFEVEVVFDALPDDVFSGRIIQIDPRLSDVSGVSAVRAIVQLDADSFAKPQTLPVGLNATVEVIGGRATEAVVVPVESLRELSPGEFAVFVMENGEPRLRVVEVGLMDFTFAEIRSGLEAGEIVTTGLVETE